MAALASYKDPGYRALANAVTADLGLPEDVLYSIITKGEKSNADQVSSAGARTVAQIIPATRKAILDRHGVDAYLSPENAVRAAGLILKDNLDRAKGDVREAVTQYVAGTGGERGPVTRAYVNRVLGAEPRAKPAAPVAPARVVEAFNSGQMTAAQAANFKKSLDSGQFSLPEGAKLNERVTVKPNEGAALIPKRVIDNYTNRSDMTDAQRDLIDRDIAAGTLRLPDGAKLNRPAELSAADRLGMGVRGVMTGAAGLADIVANPVSAIADAVIPGDAFAVNPTRTGMEGLADKMGLAKPATPGEKLANAGVEGLTGGLATAGAAPMLSALPGVAGQVGRVLASAPITDIVSSGVSTVSSEAANQAGGGPVGELAAGVVGALGPVGLAKVAERVAARFGPKVAKVVAEVPREVVLDEAGKLTDEGVEVAARQGVAADELAAAYDEAAKVVEPEAAPTPDGQSNIQTLMQEARDQIATRKAKTEELSADDRPVRFKGNGDNDALVSPDLEREGGWRLTTIGKDGEPVGHAEFGTKAEAINEALSRRLEPVESARPRAAPAAAAIDETATPQPPTPDAPLPATAAARVDEAQSLGVDLTRGQATKDFDAQSAENDLAGTGSPEGQAVRDHRVKQAEQIKAATDKFQASIGDPTIDATARGQAVKDGLRDLFDQGKAGVTAAYGRLRDLVTELGDNAKGLIDVDVAPIRAGTLDILADDALPETTRKGLMQRAAKFGIIGEEPRFIPESGKTTYKVRDDEGNLVSGGSFPGRVEPLTLANAEEFRKRVNELFDAMATRNPQEGLKPILDEAVAATAERAAREGFGNVGILAGEARDLFKGVKKTFESGDVIDRLIAQKKGKPGTEAVNPEDVFTIINGKGDGALTNIRKLKAVLLASPTEASRAAWKALQAHTVAQIFKKATVANANLGDAGFGAISGAKLNTEIQKFGVDKLRTILDPADFDQLMKIRRVVMDATIPLANTTNPSGSGHVVARFFAKQAQNLAPVAKMVPIARDIVKGVEEQVAKRATAKTVEGVTSFTPEDAAKVDTAKVAEATPKANPVAAFIDLVSTDRLVAPLLANVARSGQQPATQEPSSER